MKVVNSHCVFAHQVLRLKSSCNSTASKECRLESNSLLITERNNLDSTDTVSFQVPSSMSQKQRKLQDMTPFLLWRQSWAEPTSMGRGNCCNFPSIFKALTAAIAATIPNAPSYFPASMTVSCCTNPTNELGKCKNTHNTILFFNILPEDSWSRGTLHT